MIYDIIIIGDGPAGLSAAITLRQRGKSVAVISNNREDSGLYKAHKIPNYPGLPDISGPELSDKLVAHAENAGAQLIAGQVNTILPMGDTFAVGYGSENLSAKCVILATGVSQTKLFPGEAELLGRGVSYCATCDAMFFKGKRVCAVCLTPQSHHEADFLESIGCDVVRLETEDIVVNGETAVTSVTADGEQIKCAGVFIMRRAIAPHLLLAGLEIKDGHIAAGASGATNIPGVFAAGDCAGRPYQIAKAVGEGQVAGLAAVEYIANIERSVSENECTASDS